MNRLRIGFALTAIIGALWAAAGVFESLLQFGVGLAIASAAVLGYGLIDHVEHHQVEKWSDGRNQVWRRRDNRVDS